jgi:hypothetical protein
MMVFVRSTLVTAAMLGALSPAVLLAQNTAPSPSTSPSSTSSKIDEVSHWTEEQWDHAKAQWAREKEKWADCQKQAQDQNLTGRKSWSFLASCMTS